MNNKKYHLSISNESITIYINPIQWGTLHGNFKDFFMENIQDRIVDYLISKKTLKTKVSLSDKEFIEYTNSNCFTLFLKYLRNIK